MLRVGLTGGLGSGKSAVAGMLEELGAYVSRSDEVARQLMQPGQSVFQAIVNHFGAAVLLEDGTLNRAALAAIAFQEKRVDEINRIVHPAVLAAEADWINGIAARDAGAVAVVESALIFEAAESGTYAHSCRNDRPPWRQRFDRLILVTAPEEVRVARYLARNLTSNATGDRSLLEADARRRIAMQMPDQDKAALCDDLLPNTGSLDDLRRSAVLLYQQLRAESIRNAGISAKIDGESLPT